MKSFQLQGLEMTTMTMGVPTTIPSNQSMGDLYSNPPPMSIEKLFPALLECFGIIFCGYIAGRVNIITSTQAQGLGNFVSRFALPALLFKNMVVLDFANVIWPFLWSILIAKVSVFFIVCVLTLLVAQKDSRFSKAGIFSIFATQSNDFALGYPIVEALYRNSHPDYVQYIYLVAPVSLMILNPIGFALCEVQKCQTQRDQQQSKFYILGVVLLQVLKNPIVFMVIIGIVMHFLLDQKIPTFMEEFVDGLANSFGGAALFYLGLTMTGQLKKLTRSTMVALILLTTAKLLMMPLICRGLVQFLDAGNASSLNHSGLSNYAFIYGVFPPAPSVAIYAAHYNVELGVVTTGMVFSTILSAPIMYVSAWLLTIPWMNPNLLASVLQNVSFNISIISLVAMVWTVAVMLLSKKFRRHPHLFTVNLFVVQLLVCVAMVIWNFVVEQDNFIGQMFTFILLYGSLYSTYVWPGLIALSLVPLRREADLKIWSGLLVLVGWGLPTLTVGILLIQGEKMPNTIDSAFFYGTSQVICSTVVLGGSILLLGGSLVALSRGTQDYQTLGRRSVYGTAEDLSPPHGPQANTTVEQDIRGGSVSGDCSMCACERAPVQPVPNMAINTNMDDSSSLQPGHCGSHCESTHCILVQQEQPNQGSDTQLARHVLLCLLLLVSQLANLASCLWWLCNKEPGRLYLELQFFCVVANYGQGFISFALFGLDKAFIILPLKRRLLKLWQDRRQGVEQPVTVSEDIRLTCSQFISYHKEQCIQDIVHKKRCGQRSLANIFLGSDMVQWLQKVGLAHDQGQALLYGSRLLEGGVIQHITQDHGFQDDGLHYCFTEGVC